MHRANEPGRNKSNDIVTLYAEGKNDEGPQRNRKDARHNQPDEENKVHADGNSGRTAQRLRVPVRETRLDYPQYSQKPGSSWAGLSLEFPTATIYGSANGTFCTLPCAPECSTPDCRPWARKSFGISDTDARSLYR